MSLRSDRVVALLLGLAILLPFFNFLRFAPLADWYFCALGLLVLGFGFFVSVVKGYEYRFSRIGAVILIFITALVVAKSVDLIIPAALLFVLFFFFLGLGDLAVESRRQVFVETLAMLIFTSALIQVLFGFLQIIDFAKYFHGFVTYDVNNRTGNIFGNIGQRNHYANFLGWGIVSACYLYAGGKLRFWFFLAAIFVMNLLIAWCGSRLPFGYCLIICLLGWYWLRKSRGDVRLARMVAGFAVAVILFSIVQIFSHQIDLVFNYFGLPIHVQSGSERILAADLGARRRIEWAKAWSIFTAHPFFGVGLGNYAHYSVQMEAFDGYPKYPESWLFTNCHNLVFQLLAETGLFGAAALIVGLVLCLYPYFSKGKQTIENLFFVCIAGIILGHSMLEYPLWYWPFLSMLYTVCAFSPVASYKLEINDKLSAAISIIVAICCFVNFYFGRAVFWDLVNFNMPVPSIGENIRRVVRLREIEKNPLWRPEAQLVLSNYLLPTTSQIDYKINFFEKMSYSLPYPQLLFKLAILYSLDNQPQKAKNMMVLAISNFPDLLPAFLTDINSRKEPSLVMIRDMASKAVAVYGSGQAVTADSRVAAVMTVASPVTRKPLF